MKPFSAGIYLAYEHWKQMEQDAVSRSPEEACGFVAGEGDQSRVILPITNILHDPFRFLFDPDEELKAFLFIEDKGWDILAVYHSHPRGIDHPSATDFAELTFPGIIYLIWYQNANQWSCLGYLMESDKVASEVPVIITGNKQL
jgi:proteasome lid subunit RPN8/RPN11